MINVLGTQGREPFFFFKLGRADTMGMIVPFQRGLVGPLSGGLMMVGVWGRVLFLRSGSDIRLPTCYSLSTLGASENQQVQGNGEAVKA